MKKTNLFATMMVVTLGAAFMNCNTVEAGMFDGGIDPYGIYTITPDCLYCEYTNNNYINSLYSVSIGWYNSDSVQIIVEDTLNTNTETYILEKINNHMYMSFEDDVTIQYITDCDTWFLNMDNTTTCLHPATWEYSYLEDITNENIWCPIGLYEDSETGKSFAIQQFVDTCFYYITDINSNKSYMLTGEYYDGYAYYNFGNDCYIYIDDDGLCEYYDDYTYTTLIRTILDMYTIPELYHVILEVPYINNNETNYVYIELIFEEDDYGTIIRYNMASDDLAANCSGVAVLNGASGECIISDEFIINLWDNVAFIPRVKSTTTTFEIL